VNEPRPECTFQCLRSIRVVLQSQALRRGTYSIKGIVRVQDENAVPISGALVVGRWTLPDGSSQDVNVATNSNGVAAFTTVGRQGLYTLTILNLVRSQYTFEPSQSVLSKSITVPKRLRHPG
jgi:hypothetical protein